MLGIWVNFGPRGLGLLVSQQVALAATQQRQCRTRRVVPSLQPPQPCTSTLSPGVIEALPCMLLRRCQQKREQHGEAAVEIEAEVMVAIVLGLIIIAVPLYTSFVSFLPMEHLVFAREPLATCSPG